ncbi:PepSY domain-containing protein [Bosea vaviloviae]|nr:PepSY domain-containing protein [Bosea vaviloviae]
MIALLRASGGLAMKTLCLALFCSAMIAGGAVAQSSTATPRPGPDSDQNAPLPGVGTLTEGEARTRLQADGYTSVDELKDDGKGVWTGKAMHHGQRVTVSIDHAGTISRSQ